MTVTQPHQRLVLGRYRLGPVIGRGGASSVHRADDVHTGQQVAVKEIPVEMEMARRAGAEVRAASRLSHPSIVRLLDFGEDRSSCYLVSELVEGASLAERRRDGTGADSAVGLVGIVADIFDGLAHAHERGVTHRDVKPANILVDRSGRGRLADFGIARIAGEAGLTSAGGLVGTVSYMAPEQARGEDAGPAADVFSASLVLYEGLTGVNPIVGDSPGETLRRAAGMRIAPLGQVRPDLPAALCQAVDAGLGPDPRRRPDPAWMARTLRAQIPAVGALRPRRGGRFARVGPQVATAACGAAVAAVVLHQVSDLGPGEIAAAAAGAGAAAAFLPWHAALLAWLGSMAVLGSHSPGAALVLGSLGLVAIAPIRRRGRLALLPAAAPILAALGLAPLYAAMAGSVRGWRWRIWAALTGVAATVAWQVVAGAEPGLDGGRIGGTWADLDGVVSPVTVLERLTEPVRARPAIGAAALLLAAASLIFPLVMRLPRGLPRGAGAAVWTAGLIVGMGALGGSIESAAGAFLPAGILVVAWTAVPWPRQRRTTDRQATVTLRGSTVERLPAA